MSCDLSSHVRNLLLPCKTCASTGWLCAATDEPADFDHGTCCDEPEFGCPSANGCPDCDRSFRELGVADDLLHPLMANANQRGNSASGHASGCCLADRSVPVFLRFGVALRSSFEAFFGGHKVQSSLLDIDRQLCL